MIYYIYREQKYKSVLLLNERCIFENVHLVVVKMKSGIMKLVNMKFPLDYLSNSRFLGTYLNIEESNEPNLEI